MPIKQVWATYRFGDLCQITRGASPRPINDWIGPVGIPWVKISDATKSNSRYIEITGDYIRHGGQEYSVEVFPGDLIVSNSATPGIPKIMGINACIHDGWLLLRNFRSLDKMFALYLLQTKRDYLISQGNGSVFTNLKTEILKNLQVDLPGVDEQRRIAHILGTLDDKIENNRKTAKTLEAMAQAIFKSWFVDFDPVRAKASGESTESICKRLKMTPEILDLFPDGFEDSELGKIPRGWNIIAASSVIEFNPAEPLRKGTVAPYLAMASLPSSGCCPDLPVLRAFGSGMRFRNGDTLLARITPCLENGKTALVQCLPDGAVGWGSTEFIVLRSKVPVPVEFSYLLARDTAFRNHAIQSMIGTSGRQRAQVDSVASFKLATPLGAKVWEAFAGLIAPMFQCIQFNVVALVNLAAIRNTLLPRLISGEISLPDSGRLSPENEITVS